MIAAEASNAENDRLLQDGHQHVAAIPARYGTHIVVMGFQLLFLYAGCNFISVYNFDATNRVYVDVLIVGGVYFPVSPEVNFRKSGVVGTKMT